MAIVPPPTVRRGWREGTPLPRRLLRRLLGETPVAILAPGFGSWSRALRRARHATRILRPAAIDFRALDEFCRVHQIRHVGVLGMPATMADSMRAGMPRLVAHARIDLVAVPRGALTGALARRLERDGFRVMPARDGIGARLRRLFGGRDHDIALNERLAALAANGEKAMLDIAALCRQHGIAPRGIVHVGAHDGEELADYRRMGLGAVLLIEANPAVFKRLVARAGGERRVVLANVAIADRAGPVQLHVTSADQSSSILPIARSRDYYPSIVETLVVDVEGQTLDGLLSARGLDPHAYNLLNIDIQGAELLALKGAEHLLRHIEAINVEVNFVELYAGCAEIDDIDDHLAARGFRRVALTCPFHHSWGDAFYVRGGTQDEP